MTDTLERELQSIAIGVDYRIGLSSTGGLHVDVIYVPTFRAVDMGGRIPMVVNNGVIGHGYFTGWGKWRRARRFVRRTIDGHRRMLAETGVRQVR